MKRKWKIVLALVAVVAAVCAAVFLLPRRLGRLVSPDADAFSISSAIVEVSGKMSADAVTITDAAALSALAQAIRRYPASMKKIGEIRTMGGSFASVRPEWNILCDPEAADTVYSSGIPVYAVGLDVTMRCSLDETLLSRVAASPRATNKLLSLWYGRWSEHFRFPKSVMHDPLAVASAFTQVCRFEKPFVRADLEETRGAMLCQNAPQAGYSPVNVAEDVDRDAFYAWLGERLGCKG